MRNWLIILIFSTLLGNMNAHQVQLVTYHEKTNGILIRVVVSNVPEVNNIAAWVGQENWFYLTLNESVFAENVLENLKAKPPLLEIEGIQNQESVQIGFLIEHFISDFEIFHSQSNRVFLIHIWNKLDGGSIADIKSSEDKNKNKIFSLSNQDSREKPFYESFIDAREKYGPEKYFVWYNNWYSTEDKQDNSKKEKTASTDIWEKHWSGTQKNKPEVTSIYGPSLPSKTETKKNDKKNTVVKKELPVIKKEEKKPKNKTVNNEHNKNLSVLKNDIAKRKKKADERKNQQALNKSSVSNVKVQQKYINKKSTEDLAAYAIEPNLEKRKTYLKIGCDLSNVYVYLDGRKVGKTPLSKRIPVSSGWHRIRIDVPGAKKFNKSGIPTPDYRDVYITKGRTQKVTFKFLNKTEKPG